MSDKMLDGISEYMSYKTPEKLLEKRTLEYMANRVPEWILYIVLEYILDKIIEWSLMGVTREKI